MTTSWSGRPPPNFTTTYYDSDNYWNADLRWDGITLIDPNWQGRDEVITNWTDRTIPNSSWNGRIIP